jgi:glucose-6-phosphate 1-epimerase
VTPADASDSAAASGASPDAGDLSATLSDLNDRYGIGQAVRFVVGPGGVPLAELRRPGGGAAAACSLLGATVTGYQPAGGAPVLFVSRSSAHAPGSAIRGGIPVCWPWFGPHPSDPTLPGHGFVRTRLWSVEETETVEHGGPDAPAGEAPYTVLGLRLTDSDETRRIWPNAFSARLTVRLGADLDVTLEVEHTGDESDPPLVCSGALHSYLAVGDATRISLTGLEGTRYVDKAGGGATRDQQGPVTIGAETDRIYLDTAGPVTVDDPALGRRLVVSKGGSTTTVVWNPWIERARAVPDLADDDYLRFVCVEAVNTLGDSVTLRPGERHRLRTTLAVG